MMLALLLPLLFAPQDPAAAQQESIYAPWENGPSTDPNWFPIGVWLQDPRLAPRYAKLGVNTFVGLWKGPTREQLDQLRAVKMSVVCGMNPMALEVADKSGIIGWMQVDEPDNAKVPPAKLRAAYTRMQKRDPSRPVWLNLGQGVANDRWKGRRSPRAWYEQYVAAADIVSFDVYPITNIQRDDGHEFLWILAKGLRRLSTWSQGKKPLWNMIECTRVSQLVTKPTPAQVESEVWISLINGSRGIVYFCHNFKPKTESAALLADKEMSSAVKLINQRVLRYAPQLNSPSLEKVVSLSSSDRESPVAMMVKQLDGWTYLFCVGMRNRPSKASFSALLEGVHGKIEVLNEERSLNWESGKFEDEFKPYGIHIYRFRTGS